jgi:hypothetical protein
MNRVTRKPTSLSLDSDEDWTTVRKKKLMKAHCSNDTIRRVLIPYLGKRVEGH